MAEEGKPLELERMWFVVGNKPYCLWGWDLRDANLRFLEGIRADYFGFVADNFGEAGTDEEGQLTALSLRLSYLQGLETLFAFVGATLQAPHYVQGWLHHYRDLKQITRAIHERNPTKREPIRTRLKIDTLSWEGVAKILFVYIGDEALRQEYVDFYSKLWAGFASDFLNDAYRGEYNSIKHGLRVVPGGFSLAMGLEETPGVRAERMRTVGSSEFGTQHISTNKLSDEHPHHMVVKTRSVNWHPLDMGNALQLISYSLTNIVAFLKAFNGVQKVGFVKPSSADAAGEPWKRLKTIGVTGLEAGPALEPEALDLASITPEKIRAMYEHPQDDGE